MADSFPDLLSCWVLFVSSSHWCLSFGNIDVCSVLSCVLFVYFFIRCSRIAEIRIFEQVSSQGFSSHVYCSTHGTTRKRHNLSLEVSLLECVLHSLTHVKLLSFLSFSHNRRYLAVIHSSTFPIDYKYAWQRPPSTLQASKESLVFHSVRQQ